MMGLIAVLLFFAHAFQTPGEVPREIPIEVPLALAVVNTTRRMYDHLVHQTSDTYRKPSQH